MMYKVYLEMQTDSLDGNRAAMGGAGNLISNNLLMPVTQRSVMCQSLNTKQQIIFPLLSSSFLKEHF